MFTASSAGVVVNSTLIGETKRRLGDRIRENRCTTSPVVLHFTKSHHDIEDVVVSVLLEYYSHSSRKLTEMKLIDNLGTLDYLGWNVYC